MVPMWGFLVPVVVGILYGWLKPGRQDSMLVFRTGVPLGFVLAVVLAVLGLMLQTNPLGLDPGYKALGIATIAMSGLFALGVWVGDLIEGPPKRKRRK